MLTCLPSEFHCYYVLQLEKRSYKSNPECLDITRYFTIYKDGDRNLTGEQLCCVKINAQQCCTTEEWHYFCSYQNYHAWCNDYHGVGRLCYTQNIGFLYTVYISQNVWQIDLSGTVKFIPESEWTCHIFIHF